MSFHDGLDGSMTPYTERLYTDGSMTPLTEASWMDESMTPSSCPGTPDGALDLPLLQPPNIDRVSASGHVCVSASARHRMGLFCSRLALFFAYKSSLQASVCSTSLCFYVFNIKSQLALSSEAETITKGETESATVLIISCLIKQKLQLYTFFSSSNITLFCFFCVLYNFKVF